MVYILLDLQAHFLVLKFPDFHLKRDIEIAVEKM